MGPKVDEIRPKKISRLKLNRKSKKASDSTSSGSHEETWDSGLRNTTPTWARNLAGETDTDLLRLYSPSADDNAKKKENVSPNVRLISNQRKSPRVSGLESFLSADGILAALSSEERNHNLPEFKTPEKNPMGNREDSGSGKRKRREEDGGSRKKSSTGSVSNDIIEVGDSDEEESPPLPPTSRRTTRSTAQLSDQFKLCEFPPGAQDSVSVCVADYKSLEHDTFLNDIIIDFYLTYLFHTVLPPEERKLVHMFSTMFYKRMTSSHKSKAKEEQGLSSAQKKHSRVKTWTKNVNIFEKQFVIIPICEHSHWYLVIIIKPGQILCDAESRQNDGEPLFLVLDSLGGGKSGAVENIRHYLEQEWLAKNPGLPEASFSKKEMKTLRPKKPEQENFSDCGIFLLHYVEKIFKNLSQFMFQTSIEESTLRWLDDTSEFARKRGQIAVIIEDLSREKLSQSSQLLPALNFYVPVTRSKARKPVQRDQSTDEEDFSATNDDGEFSVAASGFYGERSGLRSGKSRTNLILENASVENRERRRDRELRSRKAKDKDLVEAKKQPSHSNTTSDYKISQKPSHNQTIIPLSSSNDKEDLFEKIRDSKTAGPVRKVARVPGEKWDKIKEDALNSIENPKALKARADLHTGLSLTRPGSQHLKLSILPTTKKRPALNEFKEKGSSQSESSKKTEDVKPRWDTAPPDSKTKLTETILSCLEQIDNVDKVKEAEVAKDLDQMQIDDDTEPEPTKVKLSLGEYRKRQQISVENKTNEGYKIEEISVVSASRSEAGGDKDDVTVVSDRDDVSSVALSVVINGGQKDDGDLPGLTEQIEETEENHEADVTTISDNEDAEAVDGAEEIQEKPDPDVTTVPDSDDEENVEEREVSRVEQRQDSGRHSPDVTIYSDHDGGADGDPDPDSRPGSAASVSIQSEIIIKPNNDQGDIAPHHRDNSDGASMFSVSSRTSTPEILLEVNDASTSRSRQDSPGPEVVQITKSIPEDAQLKITLTKSPKKSVNTTNTSSLPTIELEEDEEEKEVASSPVFKTSRATSHPKLRASRMITSKLKVSEPDDSKQISFEEGEYISTARPRRERAKFPGLSEIDKAKLKNLPYEERERAFKSLQKEDEKELSIDLTSDEETGCSSKHGGRKVVVSEGSDWGKCKSPIKTKKSSRRRE